MEKRYKTKGSTFCSIYTSDSWHKRLESGALADAILNIVFPKYKTIMI